MKKPAIVAAVVPCAPVRAQDLFKPGDLVRMVDSRHMIDKAVVLANIHEVGLGINTHQVRVGYTVRSDDGVVTPETLVVGLSSIERCNKSDQADSIVRINGKDVSAHEPALYGYGPHLKLYDPDAARSSREVFFAEMAFTGASTGKKAKKKPTAKKPVKPVKKPGKKAKKKPTPA